MELIEKFDHFMELHRNSGDLPPRVHELNHAMRRHIAKWRDEDRALFERKYLEGWSYAELALAHKLSERAVESRLHRLRQELREHLMNGGGHEHM